MIDKAMGEAILKIIDDMDRHWHEADKFRREGTVKENFEEFKAHYDMINQGYVKIGDMVEEYAKKEKILYEFLEPALNRFHEVKKQYEKIKVAK